MASIRDVWHCANSVLNNARRIINQQLKPMGISSAQGNILLHMLLQNKDMHQDQLAEELAISKGAVSRAVDALVKSGYMQRRKDERDKRFSYVSLTDDARSFGKALESIYDDLYTQAVQDISQDEFAHLVSILGKVQQNLENVP